MAHDNTSVLIVDLDGTLVKTDLLHETFWSAFANNFFAPILAVFALFRGLPALKEYVRSASDVDVTQLPYDQEVIAYIKNHRENGGRVELVTASDQIIAQSVADHLNLFDAVHGTGHGINLKGAQKAAFIQKNYGDAATEYIGNAASDMPVWNVVDRVATANATARLRHNAAKLGKPTTHLGQNGRMLRPYFKALRPYQWVKNILVFLPIFAAHKFNMGSITQSFYAFAAFSLIASSVYVMNDLIDLKNDRDHPRKRMRPFAAGTIPIEHGALMILVLLAGGTLFASMLNRLFIYVAITYFTITVGYSLLFKKMVIFDICVLAGLYSLRIIGGGVATHVFLSVRLFAFSMFFFFALAAIKRQAELVDMVKRGRLTSQGRGYHADDLPIISVIGLAAGYISVLVLAFYVNSIEVRFLYSFPQALWGICCVVLYWITRLVVMAHRDQVHDDPIIFAAKDPVSHISMLAIAACLALGLAL